jgi:tRNA pseudouridine13 synthase
VRLTEELPGSGGVLSSRPEDFVVEEILAYAPSGAGEHLFVEIEKRAIDTLEAVKRIAGALEIDRRSIGFAGMKDRHAIARQWLSLPWPIARPLPSLAAIESSELTVRAMHRHEHKLRRGHANRNRFSIAIRGTRPDGFARATATLERLRTTGAPNAFGPQRFGIYGDNADRALAFLRGKERLPPNPRVRELLFSALQSKVFNRVLELRIERGAVGRALLGDVMQKHDTGGLFDVDDEAKEQPRADRLEISPTAALPGKRVRKAAGLPQQMEDEAFSWAGLLAEDVGRLPDGTRRSLRYPLDPSAAIRALGQDAFRLDVTLPSGAYATVLLDEIVKPTDRPFARGVGDEGAS